MRASAVEVIAEPLRAAPLAVDRIGLTWQPTQGAARFHLYSDMGTGFGVYLFRAVSDETSFTDTGLRSGTQYRYRVIASTRQGEILLAEAVAATPRRVALPAASESDATLLPTRVTPAVTPAPTPLPPDTIILGLLSASDHIDEVDGSLVIAGEVRNDSNLDVGDTQVVAVFYDAQGHKVQEVVGTTTLRVLAPGIRSPFVIKVPDPFPDTYYSLRATGRPGEPADSAAQLRVVSTRRYEDEAGFFHVAGVIENVGPRAVEQARAVVVLYDRGGGVVNVGFAYPSPSALGRGDRADFDVVFTYYPRVIRHTALALSN
jgi:hypothetical protein